MKGNFLSFEEDKARFDLWLSGATDMEIAKARITHKETICGWRHRRGLPANGGAGRGGRRINTKYWKRGA